MRVDGSGQVDLGMEESIYHCGIAVGELRRTMPELGQDPADFIRRGWQADPENVTLSPHRSLTMVDGLLTLAISKFVRGPEAGQALLDLSKEASPTTPVGYAVHVAIAELASKSLGAARA